MKNETAVFAVKVFLVLVLIGVVFDLLLEWSVMPVERRYGMVFLFVALGVLVLWLDRSPKRQDLKPVELNDWDATNPTKSLDDLFKNAKSVSEKTIEWYGRSKPAKKWGAWLTRLGMILLGAAAGILPIFSEVKGLFGMPVPPVVTASLLAAVIALLLSLDKFFGWSSGWVRYIKAELQLRQVVHEFELDWKAEKAAWGTTQPGPEKASEVVGKIKAFVSRVDTIVLDETKEWITEFQSALQQVEGATKEAAEKYLAASKEAAQKLEAAAAKKAAESKTGAINLTVTNGEQCAPPGWVLAIDGAVKATNVGKTGAIREVPQGSRVIAVQGKIGGNDKRAEKAVEVPPGKIVEVELTLS